MWPFTTISDTVNCKLYEPTDCYYYLLENTSKAKVSLIRNKSLNDVLTDI